jgi:NitT/TauT family transport system ATP-binding protein
MSLEQDIRLEGVDKSFGEKRVLAGFSAVIAAGAATALMGPSGSGKTTVSRIIMGLEQPDGGRITGAKGLRFCCVFQEDRLCGQLSAADNAALALPRAGRVEIDAALRAVGLSENECTRPAAGLSGGERRRAALVRAVQAAGEVLVLDEAFKGLDDEIRQKAYAYVRRNLRGRTLILITHAPEEAEAFGAGVVRVPLIP